LGYAIREPGHLVRVCMDTSVIDEVTEAVHSFGVKIKLLFFQEKLRFTQLIEYEPEVFLVLGN
jgi:hypothetical protein